MPDKRREKPASAAPIALPSVSCWPGISGQERAYRESVLHDVERRVAADGPHIARPHPDRARQFMPFAALKGYHELAKSKERVPEPRREMTEGRALELSRAFAGLHCGDVVRITHYEGDAYVETAGAISEVVEPLRLLRVVRKPISFDDVFAIETISSKTAQSAKRELGG